MALRCAKSEYEVHDNVPGMSYPLRVTRLSTRFRMSRFSLLSYKGNNLSTAEVHNKLLTPHPYALV